MASNIPELEIPQGLADLACEGSQSAPIDDLDENQKRWLVIGIGLQSIVTPALRETVAPKLQHLYDTLVKSCHIDTQLYPNHIKKHPATNTNELNYQSINNNKTIKGPRTNNSSYDYKVQDPVELSKLFLATNMALYKGFDESCDTSALLHILEKIDVFDPAIRQAAEQTRVNVRNQWAHCNFQEWDETKYEDCFKNLKDLILSLKLLKDRETETTKKLDDLKIHGIHNFDGTKLAATIQKLAAHVIDIASKSRDNFVVKPELDTIYNYITETRAETRADVKDLKDRVQRLENVMDKPQTDIFLAPCRRKTFTGRKEYLKQIEDIFFKEQPDKQYKVSLCGLGGMGKTTIATEYAWMKRSSYPGGVFWFSGETCESFENYFHRTAALIGMSGTNFSEIYAKTLNWLSNVRKQCLIILDNVDEDGIIGSRLEFIHNTNLSDSLHHMVITSRRKPRDAKETFICKACLHVDKLSIDDSMELLKQRTSIRDTSQDAEMKEICMLLDGLPLALEQAALTIKSIECSFSSYLAEYRKVNVALLKDKIVPQASEDVNRLSVNTTWIINLKQIDQKSQEHGFQLEMQLLLDIISCLAGDDIPLAIFNVGNPPVEYGKFYEQLQNEITLKRIMHILTEFSVLKKGGETLTVHKLVQTVISNSISGCSARRIKIVESATRMMHKAALLARENLDTKMIFCLQNQCNALQQNTGMWTTDNQTTPRLKDLKRKLYHYQEDILIEKAWKRLQKDLNEIEETEKLRTLTEEEKRTKEDLKNDIDFSSKMVTMYEQMIKNEEVEVRTEFQDSDTVTDSNKSDAATDYNKSDAVTDSNKSDAATDSKKSDAATDSKKSDIDTDSNKSDTDTDSNKSDAATDSKKSDAATDSKKSDAATDSNKSDAATDSNKSDAATNSKKSDAATDSNKSDAATDSNKSDTATAFNKSDTDTDSNKSDTATDSTKSDTATECNKSDTDTDSNKSDAAIDSTKSDTATDSNKSDAATASNKSDAATDSNKSDAATDSNKSDTSIDSNKSDTNTDSNKSDTAIDSNKSDTDTDSNKSDAAIDSSERSGLISTIDSDSD